MLAQLQFAWTITGPILLLLGIGLLLRQLRLLDQHFVTQANTLVFNIAMPAMLFFALSSRPLSEAVDLRLTVAGLLGTLLLVGLLLVAGQWIARDRRGVFIQGAYRGNLAILGVALVVAAYGESRLGTIAMYLATVTTLYNVVAVWLLQPGASWSSLSTIARNPIILGIVAGVSGSLIGIEMPAMLTATGRYLTDMTLPVALICIGASLNLGSLHKHRGDLMLAVLFKLFLSPAVLLAIGWWLDCSPEQMGLLYLMAASPTASASYIMARQMTTQGDFAAEIVAVTTAMGVITYTVGLAVLKSVGWL